MSRRKIVVTGGGGFIGGHLVGALLARGHRVRCVDCKPLGEWHQIHEGAENVVADLQQLGACMAACDGMDECYQLAADMGGTGFIENNKALCMLSVLINTHLLLAAREHGVESFFYSSSGGSLRSAWGTAWSALTGDSTMSTGRSTAETLRWRAS